MNVTYYGLLVVSCNFYKSWSLNVWHLTLDVTHGYIKLTGFCPLFPFVNTSDNKSYRWDIKNKINSSSHSSSSKNTIRVTSKSKTSFHLFPWRLDFLLVYGYVGAPLANGIYYFLMITLVFFLYQMDQKHN